MPSFRLRRLQQKFLAITALALLVPFGVYAYFLFLSFHSIEEIEKNSLEGSLLRAEAGLRHRMRALQEKTEYLASLPAIEQFGKAGQAAAETETSAIQWLRLATHVDLGMVVTPDGGAQVFFSPGSLLGGITPAAVGEWFDPDPRRGGCCGFLKLGNTVWLVAASPFPTSTSPGRVILGVQAERSLLPALQDLIGARVGIRAAAPGSNDVEAETLSFNRSSKESLSVRKALRGLDEGSWYLLEISENVGLFNHLRANLILFPALFLGVALLAAFLGTGWATTLVLRPLRRLSSTMTSVTGPGDYSTRVSPASQDEIGELAESFNHLMNRLEEAQASLEMAQQNRMEAEKVETLHATVITLAHQINNPLAALLGQAELVLWDGQLDPPRRKAVETIRDMALRISEVIRKLQALPKAETVSYLRSQNMIRLDLERSPESERSEPIAMASS
jgi:signal transduction histidine kinase